MAIGIAVERKIKCYMKEEVWTENIAWKIITYLREGSVTVLHLRVTVTKPKSFFVLFFILSK